MAIIDKIRALISAANTKTGESDTTLTDAVQTLVDGYGQGGGTTPAPQKDVNFIDYDGTILYSYTAAEFAALSAMPANPDHSSDIKWGDETIALTSQGWNYTLAKAQEYVAKYGKLWIGQMYIPTDGKTYVCIHLEEVRISPMLGLCPNGTVDIDWGDGTTHDTLTGRSATTVKWTPTHQYTEAGNYIIKLDVTSGTIAISGDSSTYQYLLRYTSSSNGRNVGFANSIRSIFVGSGAGIGDYAFYSCRSIRSVTIPDSVTSIGKYAFGNCHSIRSVTLPSGMTNIDENTFNSCYSMASIAIPDSVTSIGNAALYICRSLNSVTIPHSVTSIDDYAFTSCTSIVSVTIPDSVISIGISVFNECTPMATVTIPDGVTSIGNAAFAYCNCISSITFERTTPPTVSNSNAWLGIPTDCIIYVPATSLETYKTATNYPSPTTYTYIGY